MIVEYKKDTGSDYLTEGRKYDVISSTDDCYFLVDDTGHDNFYVKDKFNIIDSIVSSVLDKYKKRSEMGMSKYGTNLDRNDLSTSEWLIHLQEELMDASLYIEKLLTEYKTIKNG